jgi:hypothetical protein
LNQSGSNQSPVIGFSAPVELKKKLQENTQDFRVFSVFVELNIGSVDGEDE